MVAAVNLDAVVMLILSANGPMSVTDIAHKVPAKRRKTFTHHRAEVRTHLIGMWERKLIDLDPTVSDTVVRPLYGPTDQAWLEGQG